MGGIAMNPECTIIIPTLNNPQGAIDLVKDFYRLHDIDKFRFISIDQTKDGIIFDKEAPVHLHIKPYRNLGFSKAMNVGWKLVTTPYTLLANDDIRLLRPRWYEDAKAYLEQSKEVLAVNPFPATRTWDGAGNVVWYWDDTWPDGTRDDRFDFVKDKPFEDYTDEDYEKLLGILGGGVGPGTTMFFTLLKTEAREIIGLLDELFCSNGEDYSFNRRCYLTCVKCNKRKYEHDKIEEDWYCPSEKTDMPEERQKFEPYQIVTFRPSLVHHQCGVTKKNLEAEGKASTYESMVNAKNIFNTKWGTSDCSNPDIYGAKGAIKPNSPWCTEIPL